METAAEARETEQRLDPRIIVVLSDGTGNSAAKVLKTNVWRLYQALDLSDSARQIAYYDDGIGTSSFKPLAFFGGAFGWGLKRNVLDIYGYLCRNWKPGDEIYAFGFSRGAFTIRVLIDFIADEGLLQNSSDVELAYTTRDAYRRYRRKFNQTGGLVTLLRNMRDVVIRSYRGLARQTLYADIPYRPWIGPVKTRSGVRSSEPITRDEVPSIAFVGVWDTVAAYGTPLAELTRGIDNWVWPLSMPNHILSPKVRVARHAVSLDDERDTFHPLLWDELEERRRTNELKRPNVPKVPHDRIRQVWFAGVHANIGGGYADDALAHTSLNWMITEVQTVSLPKTGSLLFKQRELADLGQACSVFGLMHDSRRGLAGYYRYRPRKISAWIDPLDPSTLVMRDPDQKVPLTSVMVHESVLHRISAGTDHYAPIVLPESYRAVRQGGAIAPSSDVEAKLGLIVGPKRVERQECVWDNVWWRRVTYFTTVGASVFLALLPLIQQAFPPSGCLGPQCLLTPVISGIGNVLPSVAQPWIQAFGRSPGLFLVLVTAITFLLLWSGHLQRRIQDGMRQLWKPSLERDAPAAKESTKSWVYCLRTNSAYQETFRALKWKVVPTAFGLIVLAGGVLLGLVLLAAITTRAYLTAAERENDFCADTATAQGGGVVPNRFSTRLLCWPTGLFVEKGRRYRIVLTVTEPWIDRTIGTTPIGYESNRLSFSVKYGAFLFRRSITDRWFQPLTKIISSDGEYSIGALEMREADTEGDVFTTEFEAARTGDLFLFVNDVILPAWWGSAGRFYDNNKGEADVRVERLEGT